jgi:hypothetical protein
LRRVRAKSRPINFEGVKNPVDELHGKERNDTFSCRGNIALLHGKTKYYFIEAVRRIHKEPLFAIEQSGFLYEIGEYSAFGSLADALEKARITVEQAKFIKNRK